jgi:hypothetical protein
MLNFVENLFENERDPRSGPMNDQGHSLSLSDPDRSLVLSHFLTNFLQNLASCHTALRLFCVCFETSSVFLGILFKFDEISRQDEIYKLKRFALGDVCFVL